MKEKNIPQIVATLRYGRYLSGRLLGLCYFLFTVSAVGLLLTLTISILMQVGVIESDIASITIFACVFLCGIAYGGYLSFNRLQQGKQISLWLQDAVPLVAESKRVDCFKGKGRSAGIQIEIVFQHQGGWVVRKSNGLDKIYHDYVNREIKILYSPKYDQVMFLKNESKELK